MTLRVFISYRREDSAGYALALYDRLSQRFGRDSIFMDVDTIAPGVDFVDVIEKAVGSCDVLIALMGQRWLSAADAGGQRRLDNPEDFVRLEIAAALKRNIRVIPTLVDDARMPRSQDLPDDLMPLTRRNALEISNTRFNADVGRLIDALEAEAERLTRKKDEQEQLARKRVGTSEISISGDVAGRDLITQIGHTAVPAKALGLPVLLTTIGWGVGFVIGAAMTGEIIGTDGWAITGGIGGLTTALALQLTESSRQPMERTLAVVLVWALAGAIGWGIAGAVGETINGATEYASFGAGDWTAGKVVGWFIG